MRDPGNEVVANAGESKHIQLLIFLCVIRDNVFVKIAVVFFIVKTPYPPKIVESEVITHEVASQLLGLIQDIRYDLSMQVMFPRGDHVMSSCVNKRFCRSLRFSI